MSDDDDAAAMYQVHVQIELNHSFPRIGEQTFYIEKKFASSFNKNVMSRSDHGCGAVVREFAIVWCNLSSNPKVLTTGKQLVGTS